MRELGATDKAKDTRSEILDLGTQINDNIYNINNIHDIMIRDEDTSIGVHGEVQHIQTHQHDNLEQDYAFRADKIDVQTSSGLKSREVNLPRLCVTR